MDEFKVKLDRMRGSVDENKQIAKELASVHSDLLSVKRRLSFRISQRERIDRRLTMQGQALETEKTKMDKATSALSDIIGLYEKTEMELCGQKAPTTGTDLWDKIIDIIWPPSGPGVIPTPTIPPIPSINPEDIFKFLPFILKPWTPIFINVGYPPLVPILIISSLIPDDGSGKNLPTAAGAQATWEAIYSGEAKKVVPWKFEWGDANKQDTKVRADTVECVISQAIKEAAKSDEDSAFNNLAKGGTEKYKEIKDKVNQFSKDNTKTLYDNKKVYDTATKQWTSVDTDDKDAVKKFNEELKSSKMATDVKATLFTAGTSAALYEGEFSGKGKYGSVSAKTSIGKAEAHANGYAGLFQSDPTTGELKFKPGIGVSAGASVTAFTAEEKAMLGGDMLGAYVKSTQTIGKVGAEAEASIGLYDKDGKLNPTAYAGFSAQAIAGEITGAVGAKVLGADVAASGSLNYGIGAHANFGYKDGKLSMDVGATLGVGASVKLELDVSGTIDAAKGVAEAAWNKAGEALDKAGDTLNNLKDGAKKLFGWGK